MIIAAAGHTEYLDTVELNLELSENRVKEVVIYILGEGISKQQISGKGLGETNPLSIGNDMEKKENRKVELALRNNRVSL